jgi:GNAT superfamily N-acetyltransferase
MPEQLDIHVASLEEQAAAHRNVFDLWSQGRPLDEHVAYRLNSPKHRLATWYVGCVDRQVVVSLGAYPLRFHFRGVIVPGIAIGSVYTRGDFRRRGLAAQLLASVEGHERARGAALSILYSDIDPDYYARLGYQLCPSFEGWRDLSAAASPRTSARLVEIAALEHLPELARWYDTYHGGSPLAIARNRDYWLALLQRFDTDRFFALGEAGSHLGYIRLGADKPKWHIRDYALADSSDPLLEKLYAAAIGLAHESGATHLGGWLPELAPARALFPLTARRAEITMVKPLTAAATVDAAAIAATSRFCEVDHV